jgi:hypothetical protein
MKLQSCIVIYHRLYSRLEMIMATLEVLG